MKLSNLRSRSEQGSAVMVVMVMLGIMMICVAVNTVAVNQLGRELKLLEKQQMRRLQSASPAKTVSANDGTTVADAKPRHE